MGKQIMYIFLILSLFVGRHEAVNGFVQTSGSRFVADGKTFYFNGFNAYWMMMVASQNQHEKVTSFLRSASSYGLTVARTWAFSDGGSVPLQISPGVYNEDMFKALDYVISELGKNGIRVILSLVNSNPDFGGIKQYVQWARDRGQNLNSDDEFYRNDVVKGYYKNHVQTVVTRINTITKVAYKDDATIFAWELINEPRCNSDLSGQTFQGWVTEMAAYVKSLDRNHLLEVGLEGFYGQSDTGRKALNPINSGTNFIANGQVPGIDFATIHAYPDLWYSGTNDDSQLSYLRNWTDAHVQDTARVLKKPLLFAEFGKNIRKSGLAQREKLLGLVYDSVYSSASRGGPFSGGLVWQLIGQGLDHLRDGYDIVLQEAPSTANLILQQSRRMSQLNH